MNKVKSSVNVCKIHILIYPIFYIHVIIIIKYKPQKESVSSMPIPDNFKLLSQAELQEKLNDFKPQYIPVQTIVPKSPEVLVRSNPIHETNKLLEEQNEKIDDLSIKLEDANLEISKQTNELQSIHYENMKLNSQVDILNKTIASQSDELDKLKNINAELKSANKALEESNKSNSGYWIKTILVGIFTTVLGFLLGKYM